MGLRYNAKLSSDVVVGKRSGTQEGVTQRIVYCGSHAALEEQFVGGNVSNGR